MLEYYAERTGNLHKKSNIEVKFFKKIISAFNLDNKNSRFVEKIKYFENIKFYEE